jgi:pyruvate,water dikinase
VLGEKKQRMVYATGGGRETTRNVPTSQAERDRFCLTDTDVLTLAGYAIAAERHFSARADHPMPMDMEWAKDGIDGQLYLLQARPETVVSQRQAHVLEEFTITGSGPLLLTGRAVGTKIAAGPARRIGSAAELSAFRDGDVLVAEITTPDWEPVMKRAAAIVTSRGGRTCHAAIVAREIGIPAVVGAAGAVEAVRDGQTVTVSCAEGETGRVYDGAVPFDTRQIDTAGLQRPLTAIMVNVGNPELAFATSFVPNDGVGLARLEFIISEDIKAHPMALLHPERVTDAGEREAIRRLTGHHASPAAYFVEKLSEGIATIAAAFHPKPVVVRFSDFKTNEYASLLGGRAFEPEESNPMLGFRGASRYAHPAYAEGFALECQALKRVRDEMGFTNVIPMIPFCRRVDEARRVLDAMAVQGLVRGSHGLQVYCMCEIPNNVVLIDAFAQLFDGFSIGSNDLTQLVLGVDRDSATVAFDFDERDPGVLEMLRQAVEGSRRNGRHSGICGQAPSDFPEIAEYLVRLGIDSISLNPDTVIKTTMRILEVEAALRSERPHGQVPERDEKPQHGPVLAIPDGA